MINLNNMTILNHHSIILFFGWQNGTSLVVIQYWYNKTKSILKSKVIKTISNKGYGSILDDHYFVNINEEYILIFDKHGMHENMYILDNEFNLYKSNIKLPILSKKYTNISGIYYLTKTETMLLKYIKGSIKILFNKNELLYDMVPIVIMDIIKQFCFYDQMLHWYNKELTKHYSIPVSKIIDNKKCINNQGIFV